MIVLVAVLAFVAGAAIMFALRIGIVASRAQEDTKGWMERAFASAQSYRDASEAARAFHDAIVPRDGSATVPAPLVRDEADRLRRRLVRIAEQLDAATRT